MKCGNSWSEEADRVDCRILQGRFLRDLLYRKMEDLGRVDRTPVLIILYSFELSGLITCDFISIAEAKRNVLMFRKEELSDERKEPRGAKRSIQQESYHLLLARNLFK